MSKHAHKFYFLIVLTAFVMSLSILYIAYYDTLYGVVFPNKIEVEGDTLFGSDIQAGGQNFTSGTFNWTKLTAEVSSKIDALIGENPCNKTNIKCSGNISEILDDLNPDKKPEGQIWYYTGTDNIVLDDVVMYGKGSIIIKGKNLTIAGSIEYSEDVTSSVGFIVLEDSSEAGGTIEVETSANSIYGAYYAQKEIIFKYIE